MIVKRPYFLLLALLICAAWAFPVMGEELDDSPEAVALYAKGQRLLRDKNWYDAADIFRELESRYPSSKNVDLFIFNRGKARLYLGEHAEAAATFNQFISRFSNSPLTAYAYYFLGDALYMKGEVNKAVEAYLTSYELSRHVTLNELVTASLLAAFENAGSLTISEADFGRLPKDKACALIRPLSGIYLQRGEANRANSLLTLCGDRLDPSTAHAGSDTDAQLEIALVLPLSGELQTFGQEIYNGAVIASEIFRRETKRKVKLVPYDSKGEPIEAGRIVGELAGNAFTDVIVGPLTSDEAMVASAALNCASLPMIAPAATQAGLTHLSACSFQLAPNIELEGIILAEYAVRTLGADSAVVISSTSTDHMRMSRAFTERFRTLGGTVVAAQYYGQRDKDFGIYIRDIKTMLLGQPQDSTYFINPNADTIDFDVAPAVVDCIFLPGDSRQLRQLLPQIHFYNLNGAYLGSDGWGDEQVYNLGDHITKKAVFSSPFLEGKSSEQYLKMAAAYDSRYGNRPERLSTLGYDAVNLVLSHLPAGTVTRDDVLRHLKTVRGYKGASGAVSFGQSRENIEMPLYRIESERPVLLKSGGAFDQDRVGP